MIPFLLHSRASGGGPPPGVVIDPADWAGDYFEAAAYAISGTATATLTFTLKSNGTYTVLQANTAGTVVIGSGNWHTTPGAGIGSGFEARYSVTGSSGGGSVTNGATAFTSLSSDRSFAMTVSRSTFGVSNGIRNVLVEIQPTGGPVAGSGTFTADVSAEVG